MTPAPERTIIERIEGGWDVYLGDAFVGVITEDEDGFHGLLNGGPPEGDSEITAGVQADCAHDLIVAFERRGKPFWDSEDGPTLSGKKRRKARPKLSRGSKIRTMRALLVHLHTAPSVWWRGGARPCQFVLSQQLRTIDKSLRSPNPHAGFFHVKRERREKS